MKATHKPLLDVYEWVNYRGHRTLRYWQWRAAEQFGFNWPEKYDGETWHESTARRYTKFRNSEKGTHIFFNAEAGSMSPQLLVQITPLCWGIGCQVGDGHLAWRLGPIAAKVYIGPMCWIKNYRKGFDTP